MARDRLDKYRRKRSFESTPEPDGAGAPGGGEGARFVIQEHHARRLHWDLRLERDGVLVSWALPRGVPADPDENRLAVHTEDHPLEYIDFHGEIPAGQYGAGTMTIWDRGTYEADKFEAGKVVIRLAGEKVSGRYALFRTKGDNWMIHRMDPPEPGREPLPEDVEPMKATLAKLPDDDAAWGYEIKWDGVRALAYCEPGHLRLVTRNGIEVARRYPEIRSILEALAGREALLDGELVAYDDEGRPSFQRLQRRMHVESDTEIRRRRTQVPVTYVVFDLLHLDGRSLLSRPYEGRRAALEALGLNGDFFQTPSFHRGDGARLLELSKARGLEGIVAKRLASAYQPGRRSRDWLKVKNVRGQEVVIGGWLPGKGRREGELGALLVGYYERDGGERRLRYAGKVGTGFGAAELRLLRERLEPLAAAQSPFEGRQPQKGSRFVRPELVCEVEFSEWTNAGTLRHPSYKGLREDKPARDVVREEPAEPPSAPERPGMPSDPAALVEGELPVGDVTVKLSNLDKVLYPKAGFRKRDVIGYYRAAAPVLLPHLAGRPLTLKRYPNGVEGRHFYEKQCPPWRPDWMRTAAVWSERKQRDIDFCVIDDEAALVWAANLADLELHAMLARADQLDRPLALVFDLDPGEGTGLPECARVALELRGLFEQLGMTALVKSSGSKGLHLHVPLNTPVTYDETKPLAQAIARLLEKQHPDAVVARMTRSLRRGKVLIDWSQNSAHKSTVVPFSLRARERPTVAAPLAWDEVATVADGGDPGAILLEAGAVLEQLERRAALFAPLLELRQELPELSAAQSRR